MDDAVVFFSRDFLAKEFSSCNEYFNDLKRVYIVTSLREEITVSSLDGGAIIFNLLTHEGRKYDSNETGEFINKDRFLRNYSEENIVEIIGLLESVLNAILAKVKPKYYLDEPVSGYTNYFFNTRLAEAGALCLHFQTCWLPGYLFFVSDCAQRSPVKLNLLSNGESLVEHHVSLRTAGLARPTYVINYGTRFRRFRDISYLFGSIVFRKVVRRNEFYLNRDISAHMYHLRCLLIGLVGTYHDKSLAESDCTYVIYPLHYEPESILNYFSSYQRQEELASVLLDSLPVGYELLLKEHPSQPGALFRQQWSKIRKSKRVRLVSGSFDINTILRTRNDIVVSLGSTMALEAALNGLRVGVLGDVHFAEIPGIKKLASIEDWISLTRSSVVNPLEVKKWYGGFLNDYCFQGAFIKNGTDLNALPNVLESLELIDEKRSIN